MHKMAERVEAGTEKRDARARRAGWFLAACFVAAHALMIDFVPQHAWTLSILAMTAAPLIAGGACLVRARLGAYAGAWWALTLAMLLWAGGMAGNLIASMLDYGVTGTASLSMLLFVLYGVPIIFATASTRREIWSARLVDAALALALGYLFFRHSFAFATMEGASDEGFLNLRLMFDIENLFIAVFAVIRLIAATSPAERGFFRALTLYAFAYMVMAAYFNHMQADADYGAWPDLVVPLPFLLLAWMALHGGTGGESRVQRGDLFERVVRSGGSLMLPATLLVVAATLVDRHPGLAIAGCGAAILGYGLRSIIVQLHGQHLRDELQTMLLIDALTGLANRRQFDRSLERECARTRRTGEGVGLLMIDVDHFKLLNDHFGHPVGDQRLCAVAQALADNAMRTTDVVARYGGEEFAAILPATDLTSAIAIAERMRTAVAKLGLPSPAPGGCVTVSIGIAHIDHIGDQGDEAALIAAADAALYDAKQAGRNRSQLYVAS